MKGKMKWEAPIGIQSHGTQQSLNGPEISVWSSVVLREGMAAGCSTSQKSLFITPSFASFCQLNSLQNNKFELNDRS